MLPTVSNFGNYVGYCFKTLLIMLNTLTFKLLLLCCLLFKTLFAMLGKSLAALLAIILNNLVNICCLRFQTMVTMLAIVSKRWLLCWPLCQNYGYYVGYCFKTLVTMSAFVSKLWLLC